MSSLRISGLHKLILAAAALYFLGWFLFPPRLAISRQDSSLEPRKLGRDFLLAHPQYPSYFEGHSPDVVLDWEFIEAQLLTLGVVSAGLLLLFRSQSTLLGSNSLTSSRKLISSILLALLVPFPHSNGLSLGPAMIALALSQYRGEVGESYGPGLASFAVLFAVYTALCFLALTLLSSFLKFRSKKRIAT